MTSYEHKCVSFHQSRDWLFKCFIMLTTHTSSPLWITPFFAGNFHRSPVDSMGSNGEYVSISWGCHVELMLFRVWFAFAFKSDLIVYIYIYTYLYSFRDLIDYTPVLLRVMAWCLTAPNHNLNQLHLLSFLKQFSMLRVNISNAYHIYKLDARLDITVPTDAGPDTERC